MPKPRYKVLIRNGDASMRMEYCNNVSEVKRILPDDRSAYMLDCEFQYSKNEVMEFVRDSSVCQIFLKSDESLPAYVVAYSEVVIEPDVYGINDKSLYKVH